MRFMTRTIIVVAMCMLTFVSIWTTYRSLTDSILPEPLVTVPFPNGYVWQGSILALGLSLAIGMMLFALKMAIIDEQKRLSILGIVGMTIVASISIAFNMDVLYRTAKKDFYITYSYNEMRGVYDKYLSETQSVLRERRDALLKGVARQEGEFESEVRGLRKAPAGYGTRAREEDYKLTLIQKESQVELESLEEALASLQEADALLAGAVPTSIQEIQDLQSRLRVAAKEAGAVAGIPLPPAVNSDSPLFAVFANLMDWKRIGVFEVFILALALLLDLGDIIGYAMVPNKPPKEKHERPSFRAIPEWGTPEVVAQPRFVPVEEPTPPGALQGPEPSESPSPSAVASTGGPRSVRIRRRRS